MKIVLLGAPGSGKGTQAAFLSKELNIPHISTGDIFRDNIKRGTELGLKIKSIIDAGDLCPDELTIEIVKNRLMEDDCKNGYLLDGFPRNIPQAEALDKFSAPDKVLEFSIPLEKLMHRLTGRRNCAKCKNSFHIDFIGNVKSCPVCGGELVIRADDNVESVEERLNVYTKQTAPLIEYYEEQGKLLPINADLTKEQVFAEAIKVVK